MNKKVPPFVFPILDKPDYGLLEDLAIYLMRMLEKDSVYLPESFPKVAENEHIR
jgi:hypothetical protein